ncbi:hypothetical protein BOTBODRAFT_207098 [Botryobasidium botryosum FD-172 SS1]|uniref:Zn(2)-C6 fungal-type domain-containing protein n=1 Tax=Botryobasidium botryosum (strain FD-172 SS1) TaxID=930990 RepID=A0A067NBQ8_BOTB1|nr:hypothetical protein BOTBODRAFT_207098 [Botryobasidium botryosum FD-172 SS1]
MSRFILDLNEPPKSKRIKKGTACVACRAKKRRCDGVWPTCAQCIHDGEPECVNAVMKVTPRTLILQRKIAGLEAQVSLLQSASGASGGIDSDGAEGAQDQASRTAVGHQVPLATRGRGASPGLDVDLSCLSTAVFRAGVPRHSSVAHSRLGVSTPRLIGSWWATGDPPPSSLITTLSGIFAAHEHQHTHDPRPPEFYASLHDPDMAVGSHPALRNAVCLVACVCTPGGPFTRLEPVFLRRTTYFLEQALANVDRLLDFIEASIFLAYYFVHKGRYPKSVSIIAGRDIKCRASGTCTD